MKYLILSLLFVAGCSTVEKLPIDELYEVRFGIISKPDQYPLTIDQFTDEIPWDGKASPVRYAAHVSKNSTGKFLVHYKVYFVNVEEEELQLVEDSIVWRVNAGGDGGGVLTPDFIRGAKYGEYLFAIYVDNIGKPLRTIPFRLTPTKTDK